MRNAHFGSLMFSLDSVEQSNPTLLKALAAACPETRPLKQMIGQWRRHNLGG